MNLASKIARDLAQGPAVFARKVLSNVAALGTGRLRLLGCDRVGPGARAFGRVHVANEGSLVIGRAFAVRGTFAPALLATGPHGVLTIGDGVAINYGTTISASARVEIGDGAMIGPYCVVSDTDVPRPLAVTGDVADAVAIGPRAWIAARVVIRPGVRVGAGAVVSAGSIVDQDVPDGAVVSGAPARVLRVQHADVPQSGLRHGI